MTARSLLVTDSAIWTAETEYALAVAGAEKASGFDVTVAAPRASAAAEAAGGSFRLAELPGASPSRSPADFVADLRFLSRLVREGGFDLIHTARQTSHVMAALVPRRRAPLVHLRGSAKMPARHTANRYLYQRRTDLVIVSSFRIREALLERLRIPQDRVQRILAPVDIGRFGKTPPDDTPRPQLGIPAGAPLVVNVARLAPVKGQEVLLEAMARVLAVFPGAFLVVVGEPWSGEPARLLAKARGLGIGESVIFTGSRDDVPRFLAAASVCVSSSLGSEENSRSVGEYMAAGRPVVASSVGVIPELVTDGVTGRLVPPGDPGPLGAAILEILGDPPAARAMGREGRRMAGELFSHEAFAAKLAQVLSALGVGLG